MEKSYRGSFFVLLIITILLSGCAPEATSPSTDTPLPTKTPPPTQTLTLSPTIEKEYKRISLKEFMPSRPSDIIPPLSFEIPIEFVLISRYLPTGNTDWDEDFWLSQSEVEFFQNNETYPITSFFRASLLIITYDPESDQFLGLPNSTDDEDAIQSLEAGGIIVDRIERKNVGEYPILILELETPYEDSTRAVNYVFIGQQGVPALVIYFYYSTPTIQLKDNEIWERFESSLEIIP